MQFAKTVGIGGKYNTNEAKKRKGYQDIKPSLGDLIEI